jgi:hypothetical protein
MTGNVSRARKLFDAAIVVDETHAAAWHKWGMLEMRQGNYLRARCIGRVWRGRGATAGAWGGGGSCVLISVVLEGGGAAEGTSMACWRCGRALPAGQACTVNKNVQRLCEDALQECMVWGRGARVVVEDRGSGCASGAAGYMWAMLSNCSMCLVSLCFHL